MNNTTYDDIRRAVVTEMDEGKALEKSGKLAAAREKLEAALGRIPAEYQESHIDAGKLHAFFSDLDYVEGELDDAGKHAEKSLQIYLRAKAPDYLLAEAHINRANVELRRENFAQAVTSYKTALGLRRAKLGTDPYKQDVRDEQICVNEASIADALVGLLGIAPATTEADYDEPSCHLREARRIFDDSKRDEATEAWLCTVDGEILVGQNKRDEAIAMLKEAVRLFDDPRHDGDPTKPRAMWALAQLLRLLEGEAARVRELAEAARDLFARPATPNERNRDAVQRFINGLPPA